MNSAASTRVEDIATRHRSGGRMRAVAGLFAVVLAYLGIALGAAPLAPNAPRAGLSAVDTASHRPHLASRDRGAVAITVRAIDPPRADRPGSLAAVGGSGFVLAAGSALAVPARAAGPAAASAPRAFFPRGPPQAVRSAAA